MVTPQPMGNFNRPGMQANSLQAPAVNTMRPIPVAQAPNYPGMPPVPNYPASQPLQNMPAGPNPQLPGQLGGSLPPDQQLKASLMMQNPDFQKELNSLMQAGQLSPAEALKQLMERDAQGMAPGYLLTVGTIAGGIGLACGWAAERLIKIAKDGNNKIIDGFFQLTNKADKLFNLEDKLKSINPATLKHESGWLRVFNGTSGDNMIKNFINVFLGPSGHLDEDLKALKLPSHVLHALQTASTRDEVIKIMDTHPDLSKTLRKKLKGVLRGFTKRLNYLNNNKTIQELEHQFLDALSKKTIGPAKEGVGPLGRFCGKLLFHFRRLFGEVNEGLFKSVASKFSLSQTFGRFFASIFIFGIALHSLFKPKHKESRWARFGDQLATGLAGFWGFEFGRFLLQDLGLFTRNSKLARFGLWRIAKFLPWTMQGFMIEVLLPSLTVGTLFSWGAQKVSHMMFGNPDKIEKQKKYAADMARPLDSAPILNDLAKGDAAKPGIVKGVPAFKPPSNETALTEESVGLKLMDITRNQIADNFQNQADGMMPLLNIDDFTQSH